MIDLRAPDFWNHRRPGLAAIALLPLSWIWRAAGACRAHFAQPYTARIPVICVGNVTIGGAGKTPVAIALMQTFRDRNPCFMTRGYGGLIDAPVLVRDDNALRYGDEAVLLARHAPVIVAPNRKEGLRLAEQSGFGMVIADDGFQNPHFTKTSSVLVFDGSVGIGNGLCVPAGPCRETLDAAKARAAAAVIIGEDDTQLAERLSPLPVFSARMVPAPQSPPGRVLAFAGIGRPQKFFDTLTEAGYDVIDTVSFPDHHPYEQGDLELLISKASEVTARLITTEKDYVRLAPEARRFIDVLPARLAITQIDRLKALLEAA